MNPRDPSSALVVLALILVSAFAASAATTEPLLTIVRTGDGPDHHPVSGIQAITFASDTLLLEEASGQKSAYALDTVTRIRFTSGSATTSVPVEPAAAATNVRALHLFQNRPNPVSVSTSIRFDLPTGGRVSLALYDVTGARVRTLADGLLTSGKHTVTWSGRNDNGRRVAGGVYFYRLRAEGVDETRRMVYLR